MSDALPRSVRQGEFTIAGVPLRVYVLEDGRRIVDADDMGNLLLILEAGTPIGMADIKAFARWMRGLGT